MDELWDIARVAAYLGVTERTVYNKVRAGEIPAIKVGRLWRVRAGDLEAWLAGSARVPGDARYRPAQARASVAAEGAPVPSREELEDLLADVSETLERRLAFVALLGRGVEALGWPVPVIVGGHAVEFWTAGEYATVDIDLVGASEPIGQVLGGWGFRREGRHWFDEALGIVVEVPGSQLDPEQRAHTVSVDFGGIRAYVLGIEDLVVDRLNACVHWNDQESCLWATVLLASARELDETYLRERARAEGVSDALARALEEAGR
jgi:excisionase family DNA binding protein